MKKVLLGLVVLMAAGNAYALNSECSRIGEIQPLVNQIHSYIADRLSLKAEERNVEFSRLSDEANELYQSVKLCDDAYSVNLAEQTLAALGKIWEANTKI